MISKIAHRSSLLLKFKNLLNVCLLNDIENRQFDIHYYVKDKHLNMKPKIFNRAKKSLKIVPQEILVLNKTEEELDSIE